MGNPETFYSFPRCSSTCKNIILANSYTPNIGMRFISFTACILGTSNNFKRDTLLWKEALNGILFPKVDQR